MNKAIINGRITRWLLLMHEYDITIQDRLGKDNQVVDFLSRLHTPSDPNLVLDNFPNEHVFAITVKNTMVCRYSKLFIVWKITIPVHK